MALRGCVILLFILLSGTYGGVVIWFISADVNVWKGNVEVYFCEICTGPRQAESPLALALASILTYASAAR